MTTLSDSKRAAMLAYLGISGVGMSNADLEAAFWPVFASGSVDGIFKGLTKGDATMDRSTGGSVTNIIASRLTLSYFTAKRSYTATKVMAVVNGAAGATPTLCRFGIYSFPVDDDNGVLVAATANDTAMFSVSGVIQPNFTVPVDIVAGGRYAVGLLVVTAAAVPSVLGAGNTTGVLNGKANGNPAVCSFRSGESDLPSSFASVAGNAFPHLVLIQP